MNYLQSHSDDDEVNDDTVDEFVIVELSQETEVHI